MSIPSCPLCKSSDIRRSRTRGLREKFFRKFGWRAFRCREMDCRWRGLIRTKPVDKSVKEDLVIGMVFMILVIGIFVGHAKFSNHAITGTSVASLGAENTALDQWEPERYILKDSKILAPDSPKLTMNSRGEIQEKVVLADAELRSQDEANNLKPVMASIDVYARIAALERKIEKLDRPKSD